LTKFKEIVQESRANKFSKILSKILFQKQALKILTEIPRSFSDNFRKFSLYKGPQHFLHTNFQKNFQALFFKNNLLANFQKFLDAKFSNRLQKCPLKAPDFSIAIFQTFVNIKFKQKFG
jgi:hypothetical protein